MDKKMLAEFASPSSAYRGKPFWAWNGKLEEEELRRQIRVMKRMGLGGFFMHSRVGLSTEYLGDDWFKAVGACIDEARQLGMEAWLYDEDRWPSGAAGGIVTKNPKYRMRSLEIQEYAKPAEFKWTDNVLAAFTARIEGAIASEIRKLAPRRLRPPFATCPRAIRCWLSASSSTRTARGTTASLISIPLAMKPSRSSSRSPTKPT